MKQGADIAGGSSACAHALAACVWRISATTAKELVTPCRPLLSRTVQPDFGLWRKFGGGNCDKMIRVNPNDLDQLAACRSALGTTGCRSVLFWRPPSTREPVKRALSEGATSHRTASFYKKMHFRRDIKVPPGADYYVLSRMF